MTRPRHLIVFAREPRIGRVKRRLSAGLGVVAATFWYRRQLESLLRRLRGHTPRKTHLFLTPKTALHTKIWPKGWSKHAQISGDLGARMHHALSTPRTGPVVLVGSDIPGIQPSHIEAAFQALGRADVVLGPAEDGGYWLIGVAGNKAVPRLESVRWSTPYALTDTTAGFPSGTKVTLLETLRDIDEASDLEEI